MNPIKPILDQLLSNNIVRVTFIKSDGTTRVMNCTKSGNFIPTEYAPKQDSIASKNIQVNTEVARVFDVDLQSWRSFKWDSVQSWYLSTNVA